MTIDFLINRAEKLLRFGETYGGYSIGELKSFTAYTGIGKSQLDMYHNLVYRNLHKKAYPPMPSDKSPYIVAELPVNQAQINWGRQNGKTQFMMDVMDFYKAHGRYPTFKEMGMNPNGK